MQMQIESPSWLQELLADTTHYSQGSKVKPSPLKILAHTPFSVTSLEQRV